MDENGHKSIKMRNGTWQTLTRIKARTGEPITQIVARLADDEEKRLTCTHTYPGGIDCCALCGARRRNRTMEGTEMRHADGSTTYTFGDRSVRASRLRQTFYNDRPCYLVYLRGDVGLFFGDDGGGILKTEDYEGGTNVWYVPQDENFAEYSSELTRLGVWEA